MSLIDLIKKLTRVSERPSIPVRTESTPNFQKYPPAIPDAVDPLPGIDPKDAEIDRLKKQICNLHEFAGNCQSDMLRFHTDLNRIWAENESTKASIRGAIWELKDYFKSA